MSFLQSCTSTTHHLACACREIQFEKLNTENKRLKSSPAMKWEADHQRACLEQYGLEKEFHFGCDSIDHIAEALIAARTRVTELENEIEELDGLDAVKVHQTNAALMEANTWQGKRISELDHELGYAEGQVQGLEILVAEKDYGIARLHEIFASQCNTDDRAPTKLEEEFEQIAISIQDLSPAHLREKSEALREVVDASREAVKDLNLSLKDGVYKPLTVQPVLEAKKRLMKALFRLAEIEGSGG